MNNELSIPSAPGDHAPRFRIRTADFQLIPASEILVNPKNWRTHPQYQTTSLTAVLERIGFVGALICWRRPDGMLELLDGHLRKDLLGDQEVPVAIADLTPAEADEILATYDQMTSLAVADHGKLTDLLGSLQTRGTPLVEMGWPSFQLDQVMAGAWKPPVASGGGGSTSTMTATTKTDPEAPEQFPVVGEDIEVEHVCPKCAYRFSGGKTVPKGS